MTVHLSYQFRISFFFLLDKIWKSRNFRKGQKKEKSSDRKWTSDPKIAE
jgi:hypothetical protein